MPARRIPPKRRLFPTLYGAELQRVNVKAWSYAHSRTREVYVDIHKGGEHVVCIRLLVGLGRRSAA